MRIALNLLERTRASILEATADLSEDQLLNVPEGFGNNILWNLGHLVVSQQQLTYGLCGLPVNVDREMLGRFRKGTSPRDWQGRVDVEQVRALALSLAAETKADFDRGVFEKSHGETRFPYRTSLGGDLDSVADAVHFNNLHEGLHFGIIKSPEKTGSLSGRGSTAALSHQIAPH